jgi:hypothetical protein
LENHTPKKKKNTKALSGIWRKINVFLLRIFCIKKTSNLWIFAKVSVNKKNDKIFFKIADLVDIKIDGPAVYQKLYERL